MSKLRFAVVGCGKMGMRRIQSIKNHPETELVCVSDNHSELARKAAQELGGPYYVDYQEAVSRPDVDCVIVSTPNMTHAPATLAALRAKKHVFCEKPLARNEAEALDMVKASLENGVTLKVGSNLRYFPSVQRAKELLDGEAIGRPLFLRGWIGNAGEHLKSQPWFSDPELAGGGTFLDNGCHLLDISRWFLGEVKECQGLVATAQWPIAVEDNGLGLFTFQDSSLALIQASWTEWAGYMYLEVCGSEGLLRIDNRGQSCQVTHLRRDGYSQVYDYSLLPPQSYALEFRDYVAALKGGRQPQPSGFDGLRAVQMAHGVYKSSAQGCKMSLWGEAEESLARALRTI